ncbi:hypothetical protein [Flavobacterium sp. 3HN19-14]|uniref:hypothetical protein n=1 Tax=Flavobacterium sp. 3HN19-14 TaxID=3448133 RepID=UPI003EDEAB3C
MKRILIGLMVFMLFIQCNKKEEIPVEKPVSTEKPAESKKFEMYKMSEMAALMEQMYVDNERLKARILNGDTIGKFPDHFMNIHKAVMTDESENDAFFKLQAKHFISVQKLIYEDPKNAKEHFNDGVKACITCHEGKCHGPIPRIKKLYID